MSTDWAVSSQPPSAYHDDPSEGGPPLASPDGHWWWDGRAWVLRSSVADDGEVVGEIELSRPTRPGTRGRPPGPAGAG